MIFLTNIILSVGVALRTGPEPSTEVAATERLDKASGRLGDGRLVSLLGHLLVHVQLVDPADPTSRGALPGKGEQLEPTSQGGGDGQHVVLVAGRGGRAGLVACHYRHPGMASIKMGFIFTRRGSSSD